MFLSAVARRGSFAKRASSLYASTVSDSAAASWISEPRTVSVIGAPTSYGQPLMGTESSPAALRGDGALRHLVTSLAWRWCDRGDVPAIRPTAQDPSGKVGAGGRNAYAVGRSSEVLAAHCESAARDGHFVLTLGGDHSVALGSIAGLLRAHGHIGVLWIDAHADINAPSTSPSGNMHGMPLSFLLHHVTAGAAPLPGFEWLQGVPPLRASDIVYIGLRDLDPAEKRSIKEHNIRAYTMHHVDKYGIGRVVEMALDYLASKEPSRPLHLSFDIDAVDPYIAPSTGTTVPGGLSFREAHYICEACARSGKLGSMDLVEINPAISTDAAAAATVTLGRGLIGSALGKDILQ